MNLVQRRVDIYGIFSSSKMLTYGLQYCKRHYAISVNYLAKVSERVKLYFNMLFSVRKTALEGLQVANILKKFDTFKTILFFFSM